MTGPSQNKPPSPVTADGIWLDCRMAPLANPRPALFLDRDGVIVYDTGFLSDPDSVTIIPETAELIRQANQSGVPVLVVTNQSGIDRGLFDWDDFAAVELAIANKLTEMGARSDATAACPFHPDFTEGYGDEQAQWRKPGPDLLKASAGMLGIAMQDSWLIGDHPRDILAARNAGLAGGILIGDQALGDDLDPSAATSFTVRTADSAAQAAGQILATNLFAEK